MKYDGSHLSDQQLLLYIDGEFRAPDAKLVQSHLDACWKCRARRQELENAIANFVRVQQAEFDTKAPPAAGPRALLKARLAQFSVAQPTPSASWFAVSHRFSWPLAAAACGVLGIGLFLVRLSVQRDNSPHSTVIVSVPDSAITPGATVLASRQTVCAEANIKNKIVPVALQRKVLQEYGIAGAEPRAYEIDYLVTPALGGADDIHNLWPHSYSATVWNSEVKDALEDRLRELVCDGSLDLPEAQREIATNWIAAYKKYFQTDRPLQEHFRRSIQ
jgi:hypothetical protein